MGFYESEDMTSRDVVRLLSMQSYVGGMRVLLLGDVEFASPPAANALLKFLEEPPRGVLLVLTTSTPGRLLATIRSRLIELRFGLLSKEGVRDVLRRRGFSHEDADLGASLGGGSVTRALAALENEEESLRAQVARWFFESIEGKVPERSWATRETLDEGLLTVKALARDWVVAGPPATAVPLVCVDYANQVRRLAPAAACARRGAARKARAMPRGSHARTCRAAMVGEIVRMALTVAGRLTKSA